MDKTGAQRGLAVDSDLTVLDTVNVTEADYDAEDFTAFACIRKAYRASQRPFVTNNLFLDAAAAPNTNQTLTNLRLVVVFPLEKHGAVYVDRLVSAGMIPQQEAQHLMRVAEAALAQPDTTAIDAAGLVALYQSVERA